MRILVVQITRMGDVIQTSPLVHALRLHHPEAHIAMMVRKMGKLVAERHPDVDEVIVYNEDNMFIDLRSRDSDRLLKAYRETEQFIDSLKAKRFDVAYNTTNSLASAMLLRLTGIPEIVGADLSDDGCFIRRGRWVNYFFTSVFCREYNDLNLCDIFRHFVRPIDSKPSLYFTLHDEDRAHASALLRANDVTENDFIVCMQLGASEDSKRWAVSRYAELARLLIETYKAKIFLVGVQEEACLGNEFMQLAPGAAVPLYGHTTLSQLGALLECSDVLITNDTGTMHVAAAVKCPVTLVSVGHVHYRETGPYGEGHCAIEYKREFLGQSDLKVRGADEHTRINSEQVLAAVRVALMAKSGGPEKQMIDNTTLANVDLYYTRMAPDSCLAFYPVIRRPMHKRDLLRLAYRAMWLRFLHCKEASDVDHDQSKVLRCLQEFIMQFDGFDADEPLHEYHKTCEEGFTALGELAAEGAELARQLLDILSGKTVHARPMTAARDYVENLMQLDEKMRLHGELHPACKPLVLIARFERDNLEGADPIDLARTTRDIYRATITCCSLLNAILDQIISLCETAFTDT